MKSSLYFYNSPDFNFTRILEENVKVIQDELKCLLNENIATSDSKKWVSAYKNYVKNTSGANWKTFEFIFLGIERRENIALCPETFRLLNNVSGLVSAQFSVMSPNTHILPHKGFTSMLLRSHLGVIIPDEQKCGLRIETETYHWKEGEVVVFDDSFEHEAWNFSQQPRIVLMFDFVKPDSPYTAKEICNYKLSNLSDNELLKIAPKEKWIEWLEQGYFSGL